MFTTFLKIYPDLQKKCAQEKIEILTISNYFHAKSVALHLQQRILSNKAKICSPEDKLSHTVFDSAK